MRATGIGSLPFRGLEEARALLAKFELPFLPELPNVTPDDLMLRRPFAGLLDEASETPRLRGDADLETPPVFGPGLELLVARQAQEVKLQVAGPNTLGSWVEDARGKPLAQTAEGRAFVLARIERVARALIGRFKGKRILFFLDEPGLERVGDLAAAIERVRAAGAERIGVHDCGPRFTTALAARPDVLSFDMAFFRRDGAIEEHVRRGGVLSFGAVSTTTAPEAASELARRLTETGLLEGALVTPACGTALLGEDAARTAHERALDVARLLAP
jgi:hypothetical protein